MRAFLLATRFPRQVLAGVAIVSAVAVIVSLRAPGLLSDGTSEFVGRGTQSYRAGHVLTQALGPVAFPNLAVILPPADPHGSTVLAAVQRVATLVPRVYPSRTHRTDVVIGYFHHGVAPGPAAVRLARQFHTFRGVVVGGLALAEQQLVDQTKTDVTTAEIIALPLLLLLALLVFRSVIAALLPILATLAALSVTLALLKAINAVHPVSILSLDLVVGLTVGLSLDYSLLLLSRCREELDLGQTPQRATTHTILSAGRTVAISAATVAVAFAVPLVFPIPFVRSLAIGGMLAAIISGLAALTVLPALLSLLGRRIDMLAIRSVRFTRSQHRAWERIAGLVVRRPVVGVLAAVAVVASLSGQAPSMRLTGFTVEALPESSSAFAFERHVRDEFPYPLLGEVVVLAKGPKDMIIHSVTPAMERLPNIAAGIGTHIRGDLWVYNIKTTASPFSNASQALVRKIRALPFRLSVTGTTANFIDTANALEAKAPLAAALMIGLMLLLLFLATGSVILPCVAVVANALPLISAFGVVVLVFQDGHFTGLLNYRSLGAIILTQPVLLAAGIFGVLTDYGVFMLTRIREGHDAGLSNAEAVKRGLERTGPVISSAAMLFCVAVGALMTAQMAYIKELSLGIVTAVVIDVTVIRALLLPGLMVLLGRWSWWRPRLHEMVLGHRAEV
jgi:uncharacterized membrane protein YdfJ with MMPL/SSD domain